MRNLSIGVKIWAGILLMIGGYITTVFLSFIFTLSIIRQIDYVDNEANPVEAICRDMLHDYSLVNAAYEAIGLTGETNRFSEAKSYAFEIETALIQLMEYESLPDVLSGKVELLDDDLRSLLHTQQQLYSEWSSLKGEPSLEWFGRMKLMQEQRVRVGSDLEALCVETRNYLGAQFDLLRATVRTKVRMYLVVLCVVILISFPVIVLVVNKYTLRPLNMLLHLVRGDINELPEPFPADEIGELAHSFLAFRNEQREQTARLEEEVQARATAERDLLTHQENLEETIKERTRSIMGMNLQLHRSTAALMKNEELLRNVFTSMHEGLCLCDLVSDKEGVPEDYRIVLANPAFQKVAGISSERARGALYSELYGPPDPSLLQVYAQVLSSGNPATFERYEGLVDKQLAVSVSRVSQKRFTIVMSDISAQKYIEMELQRAQKLESVGQLAAGIAHEINTPIQFIGDNAQFMKTAFDDLFSLHKAEDKLLEFAGKCSGGAEVVDELMQIRNRIDLPYLQEEIPQSIEESLEGIRRVSSIVLAMKEFAHPGAKDLEMVDLNKSIDTTIIVARNEWKYVTTLETDFDPMLPLVPCLRGEINQVVLNLIINARDAIEDNAKDGVMGSVVISTSHDDQHAYIRVKDTGGGVPEEIKDRIFDPFYTTKEVGRGSGQGLSIARTTIIKKHHGDLRFISEDGVGTTFIISLPLSLPSELGE